MRQRFEFPVLSISANSALSNFVDVFKVFYIHQLWSEVTKNASQLTSKAKQGLCVGWAIFSKMLPSFPPQYLRVFEGDPQKTLKANPHFHLEILALNLKNSALILTSNFEGF